MKSQPSFSHGLLYSVAPGSLSSLHLIDEVGKNDFDWESYEADYNDNSLISIVFNLIKTTGVSWGLIKLH